jgi:hypothetical protein
MGNFIEKMDQRVNMIVESDVGISVEYGSPKRNSTKDNFYF